MYWPWRHTGTQPEPWTRTEISPGEMRGREEKKSDRNTVWVRKNDNINRRERKVRTDPFDHGSSGWVEKSWRVGLQDRASEQENSSSWRYKRCQTQEPSPPHQLQHRRPLHKPQPWQEHRASLGSDALTQEFSSPRKGLAGACMAQSVSMTEKLYFNGSARTVIVCLSHGAEDFSEAMNCQTPTVPAQVQHLCHITLSLQDKVSGKIPGSSHPYACSGLCLLLSEYLACLWPSKILVDFWHTTLLTKDTLCALFILVRYTWQGILSTAYLSSRNCWKHVMEEQVSLKKNKQKTRWLKHK